MSSLTEQLRQMHGLVNWSPTTAGSGVGLKLQSVLSSLLKTHVFGGSKVERLIQAGGGGSAKRKMFLYCTAEARLEISVRPAHHHKDDASNPPRDTPPQSTDLNH